MAFYQVKKSFEGFGVGEALRSEPRDRATKGYDLTLISIGAPSKRIGVTNEQLQSLVERGKIAEVSGPGVLTTE